MRFMLRRCSSSLRCASGLLVAPSRPLCSAAHGPPDDRFHRLRHGRPSETSGVGSDRFVQRQRCCRERFCLSEGRQKSGTTNQKGCCRNPSRHGDATDIAPQVLPRHGAMLGSTGSGKRSWPRRPLGGRAGRHSVAHHRPSGRFCRLALGIDLGEQEKNGLVTGEETARDPRGASGRRSQRPAVMHDFFARRPIWTEEAITAWDMVAAGSPTLPAMTWRKPRARRQFLYEILVEGRCGLDVGDFQALLEWFESFRNPSVSTRTVY